ncbi:hypothetical protein [Kocuria sp.]|uniref:hypothetical protein n=1 Tax=Kocuria sp. TaxID=1871328 RepID=UPI0026DFA13A|nr:hypothetical protein [Kocuria sp.]MDO5618753.1 hypothetical protein [Kocuria sp.]
MVVAAGVVDNVKFLSDIYGDYEKESLGSTAGHFAEGLANQGRDLLKKSASKFSGFFGGN